MAEKNSDDSVQEEPVIVTATRSWGEGLGAAIEIMETKLAKSGVVLQYPTRKVNQVTGKLRILPFLIDLGISASIDSGVGKEESIGKLASKDALVPGNIVALYHPVAGCFLRIKDKKADFGGGKRPSCNDLPVKWDSERFLVVDAGNGNIALFNPSYRQFLGCKDNCFDASGYHISNLDEKPRAQESFRIKDVESKTVRFHCDIENGSTRVDIWTDFYVVQVHGFQSED